MTSTRTGFRPCSPADAAGQLRPGQPVRLVVEAQADGSLNAALPPIAVLYTLYARACDPVLGFLRASGQYDSERIIEMVLSTCFDGLRQR